MKSTQQHLTNIYEEKRREFNKSRLAKRLQKKYSPKPFEEEYGIMYRLCIAISYFANFLSAVTASTFVYSFVESICSDLPYGQIISVFVAGLFLITIEITLRYLASKYFRTRNQFGHKAKQLPILIMIIFIASGSIFFSYQGGQSIVESAIKPPSKIESKLKDVDATREKYMMLIKEASKDAQEYKDAKTYLGKLSNRDAKVYNDLLQRKAHLQDQMIAAIQKANSDNSIITKKTEQQNTVLLEKHQNRTHNKGSVLGFITAVLICLFFLSMWFVEYYDYNVAIQYGIMASYIYKTRESSGISKRENGNSKTFSTSSNQNRKGLIKHVKQNGETVYYTPAQIRNIVSVYRNRYKEAIQNNKSKLANRQLNKINCWLHKLDSP